MKLWTVRYIVAFMLRESRREGVCPQRMATRSAHNPVRKHAAGERSGVRSFASLLCCVPCADGTLRVARSEFNKHAALRSALHKDLINTGDWAAELGKDYDLLIELRETGDYGGTTRVSEENARRAIEAAQRIITACRPKLSSIGE